MKNFSRGWLAYFMAKLNRPKAGIVSDRNCPVGNSRASLLVNGSEQSCVIQYAKKLYREHI
jgi:hypothetical protein